MKKQMEYQNQLNSKEKDQYHQELLNKIKAEQEKYDNEVMKLEEMSNQFKNKQNDLTNELNK